MKNAQEILPPQAQGRKGEERQRYFFSLLRIPAISTGLSSSQAAVNGFSVVFRGSLYLQWFKPVGFRLQGKNNIEKVTIAAKVGDGWIFYKINDGGER